MTPADELSKNVKDAIKKFEIETGVYVKEVQLVRISATQMGGREQSVVGSVYFKLEA